MGGEKPPPYDQLGRRAGSPPRGRGKGLRRHQQDRGPGITPAWAGKSHAVHSPSHGAGDHPRVGGEKAVPLPLTGNAPGSPPRGRGKGAWGVTSPDARRITPAWAGKSVVSVVIHCLHGDHPRVGGEKRGIVRCLSVLCGSPPRGRGKVCPAAPRCAATRITPAWAGKSVVSVSLSLA